MLHVVLKARYLSYMCLALHFAGLSKYSVCIQWYGPPLVDFHCTYQDEGEMLHTLYIDTP